MRGTQTISMTRWWTCRGRRGPNFYRSKQGASLPQSHAINNPKDNNKSRSSNSIDDTPSFIACVVGSYLELSFEFYAQEMNTRSLEQ